MHSGPFGLIWTTTISCGRPPFFAGFRCLSSAFTLVNQHIVFGTEPERVREIQALARWIAEVRAGAYWEGNLLVLGQLQLLQPFFGLALAATLLGEQVSVGMLAVTLAVVGAAASLSVIPFRAAAVTGLVVGAAGGAATYGAMEGCEAVRGVSTCGGAPANARANHCDVRCATASRSAGASSSS